MSRQAADGLDEDEFGRLQSDSDSISLTSSSESSYGGEYTVERIVAERELPSGEVLYLVKWEGYEHHSNTWEPITSFSGSDPFHRWELDKADISRGLMPAFDDQAWEKEQTERIEAKERRKARRQAKRRRNKVSALANSIHEKAERRGSQDKQQHLPQDIDDDSLSTDEALMEGHGRRKRNTASNEELVPSKKSITSAISQSDTRPASAASQQPQKAQTHFPLKQVAKKPEVSNIFHNWEKPLRKKTKQRTRNNSKSEGTSKETNGGKGVPFTTWTEVKRAQFASKQEPTPDLSQLNYIDLKRGVEDSAVREHFVRRKSLYEDTQKEQPHKEDHGVSQSGPQNEAKETVPWNSAMAVASIFATAQPPDRKEKEDTSRPSTSDSDQSQSARREEVQYRHDGTKREKFRSPPLTCWFFWQGQFGKGSGCVKSDEECDFAHWNTGYVADRYTNSIVSISKTTSQLQDPSSMGDVSMSDAPSAADVPMRVVPTCWYWYHGYIGRGTGCKKSDQDCVFAHSNTGWLANPASKERTRIPLDPSNSASAPSLNQSNTQKSILVDDGSGEIARSQGGLLATFNTPSLQAATQPASAKEEGSNVVRSPQMTSGSIEPTPFPVATVRLVLQQKDHSGAAGVSISVSGLSVANRDLVMDGAKQSAGSLEVTAMCLAFDYQRKYFGNSNISEVGDILPVASSAGPLKTLAGFLNLNSAGALILHERFAMVIYGATQDEWNFLPRPRNPSPHATLRFHMRDPIMCRQRPVMSDRAVQDTGTEERITLMMVKLFKLDPKMFFQWPKHDPLEKNVFLMFPTELPLHKQELEQAIRFFHAVGAKVYHPKIAGSWDYFVHHVNSGVVVFNPRWHSYHKIPGFGDILCGKKKINCFEFGRNIFPEWDYDSNLEIAPDVTYRHLFPTGTVILITDEIFAYHPDKAYAVIEAFKRVYTRKTSAWKEYCKIAARSGLKGWTLDLALQHHGEDMELGRETRAKISREITQLLEPEDPKKSGEPGPHAPLVAMNMEDFFQDHAEHWDKNEKEASDWLVVRFAQWSASVAHRFRRFVVVTGPNMNKNWPDQFRHMKFLNADEVMRWFLPPDPRPVSKTKETQHTMRFLPRALQKGNGK